MTAGPRTRARSARRAPRRPRPRRSGIWIQGVAGILALVMVAVAGIWLFSRQQCFVTSKDGQVVVAGGLPSLWPSTRQVVGDIRYDRLPEYLQAQLDAGMRVSNCDTAVSTVLDTLRSSLPRG